VSSSTATTNWPNRSTAPNKKFSSPTKEKDPNKDRGNNTLSVSIGQRLLVCLKRKVGVSLVASGPTRSGQDVLEESGAKKNSTKLKKKIP